VAIGVIHGAEGQRTALALGGGCALSVGDAWSKALAEAFSVHRWLSAKAAQQPELRAPEADHISSFDDHMLFYADPGNARLAAFLDASPERTRVHAVAPLWGTTPRAALREVLARLERAGVSAYAVDVTSPDVAELGVSVARVVAPELCPLDVVQAARYLGGRRLYHAAHEAGLAAAPLRFDEVNPHPHPFP
jgi:ribosomal protein S12 methylthiotransferase accessory factor